MLVEVWSDIMCPFCYIGKRHFEQALATKPELKDVELVWKSFQLDPGLPELAVPGEDVYTYLSRNKGISREQVMQMHDQVQEMATEAGLEYHLDKMMMVNSFKAHCFLQKAKERGIGDPAEEVLFRANFTEGMNFGDPEVLEQLGQEIGLSGLEVAEALTDPKYAALVEKDIQEAHEIGVTGVPFFVFNRKYAVSGAQPVAVFQQVLEKAFQDLSKLP